MVNKIPFLKREQNTNKSKLLNINKILILYKYILY